MTITKVEKLVSYDQFFKENLPYFNSPLTLSHSVSHSLQRNDYENPHQSTQNLPNQL